MIKCNHKVVLLYYSKLCGITVLFVIFIVIITEEYTNEEEMVASSFSKSSNFVGVVFKDLMSYELRFFPDKIPVSSVYLNSRGK